MITTLLFAEAHQVSPFPQEDQKLLRAITQVPKPIKWPEVAALVPQRSGKQCRERYFNHLCAKVKSSEWLPWEDAMLIRMYSLLGSKWSKISRTIPGRTDNSLKNRFHYMRRQIEKYGNSIPHRASVVPSPLKRLVDGVCTKMTKQHDELTFTICDIFLDALSTGKRLLAPIDDAAYFGKFHPPRVPAPCTRCGLIVPSSQTGTTMCSKTGWCRACFETPTFIRDGLLRLEHSLRASGDRKRISFCASD